MNLLLTSAGFRTPEIVAECERLAGKSKSTINVAIINEAYAVEEGDKYWVLDDLNGVAQNFKGGLDLVNLLALPLDEVETRIQQRDVIFVLGGHTDYLMHVFNKTGFSKLLPKLLETKVYVGSSAGSMVLGKRLSAVAYKKIYNEDSGYGIDRYLEFVDLSIIPHLDSPHFPNCKETLLKAAKDYSGTVYGLRDDSAIVVDGSEQRIVGSGAVRVVGHTIGSHNSAQ